MDNDAPKVNVFNRQRKIPLNRRDLLHFLEQLRVRLCPENEFSVALVSDAVMRDYCIKYKSKREPTDVLSFRDSSDPWEVNVERGYLGDILISVETADRQSGGRLEVELKRLSLHGLLHLMGYDHETDSGEMKALEKVIRKEFRLQ